MATHATRTRERLTQGEIANPVLVFAFLAVGIVSASYILTHQHPAYEGGLYLQIIDSIRLHGYGLPTDIPYYTAGGLPFAYPPLMFYLDAAVFDLTGVDPVWYTRVMPPVLVLAYLVPYYLLAREFLETPRRAAFATLLFGVAPPVLRWHLSAGGIVRAPAMLFTLIGIYTGLRLFRSGETRWLVASTVLWAIVVASHPVYTVFFALSYLVLYATFDRSLLGLLRGSIVAVGGLVLTAPWWLLVMSRHGADIFLMASSSRSSLGGGIDRILAAFVWPLVDPTVITVFYALAFAGTLYAVYRRRVLLPLWLASAGYVIGVPRFTFVPGSMLAAALVFGLIAAVRRHLPASVDRRRVVTVGILLLVAMSTTGVGVGFAGSDLDTAHQSSSTLPQTVDSADLEAAQWAETNTAPSDSFVVLGDGAEWFPYYSHRTILVSPWGTEWTERFHLEGKIMKSMSLCEGLDCLERNMDSAQGTPEYLYVPTEEFTVRGKEYAPRMTLVAELMVSEDYHLRYRNEGVAIFEVDTETSPAPSVGTGHDRAAFRSSERARGLSQASGQRPAE